MNQEAFSSDQLNAFLNFSMFEAARPVSRCRRSSVAFASRAFSTTFRRARPGSCHVGTLVSRSSFLAVREKMLRQQIKLEEMSGTCQISAFREIPTSKVTQTTERRGFSQLRTNSISLHQEGGRVKAVLIRRQFHFSCFKFGRPSSSETFCFLPIEMGLIGRAACKYMSFKDRSSCNLILTLIFPRENLGRSMPSISLDSSLGITSNLLDVFGRGNSSSHTSWSVPSAVSALVTAGTPCQGATWTCSGMRPGRTCASGTMHWPMSFVLSNAPAELML
mmetsp:Transcript_2903/g.6934  ORF Transcript_2903/g.6934 Transcript_2903/m.6934 type:complete len:277 (+) Transcript_2903:1109-1939(+)